MKFILLGLVAFFALCTAALSLDLYYSDYDPGIAIRSVDVPIVGVSPSMDTGILGIVHLSLISPDQEGIVFGGGTKVDETTIKSILDAYGFAYNYTGFKGSFMISYDMNSASVSGASTGASIATGMVYLLTGTEYDTDYIMSGAVDKDGNMLETGGLPVKLLAIAGTNKTMVFPMSQTNQTVYEKRWIGASEVLLKRNLDLVEFARTRDSAAIGVTNLREILNHMLQ